MCATIGMLLHTLFSARAGRLHLAMTGDMSSPTSSAAEEIAAPHRPACSSEAAVAIAKEKHSIFYQVRPDRDNNPLPESQSINSNRFKPAPVE